MTTKTLWRLGFVLSFLTFATITLHRLELLPAFVSENMAISSRKDTLNHMNRKMPEFQVYTQDGQLIDFKQFLDQELNLILFLGPGCYPCSDKTISLLVEFEKTIPTKSNKFLKVLVNRPQHEYQHLQLLKQYNFEGPIAKFSASSDFDLPDYPALLLISGTDLKIKEIHFPRATAEKELYEFLEKIRLSIPNQIERKQIAYQYSAKDWNQENKITNVDSIRLNRLLTTHWEIPLIGSKNDVLLSSIIAMAIGMNGEIFLSYDRGRKIILFDKAGKFIERIDTENLIETENKSVYHCVRVVTVDESRIGLLFMGPINQVILYDWQTKIIENITPATLISNIEFYPQVNKRGLIKNNSITDVTFLNKSYFFVLVHPRRQFGQLGLAKIFEYKNTRLENSFGAFPSLQFPDLSEHLATYHDQITILGNVLYTSCPLDDRIYRFNLSGNRLPDLVYPKGVKRQLNEDAPEDYSKWPKYWRKLERIDVIREVFPFARHDREYIIVARQLGKTLFFDLFYGNGEFAELGEYSNLIEVFPYAHKEGYIYGYKWPKIDINQFNPQDNPRIVVLAWDQILKKF